MTLENSHSKLVFDHIRKLGMAFRDNNLLCVRLCDTHIHFILLISSKEHILAVFEITYMGTG